MVTQNHFVIPATVLEKFRFPQEGCQTGRAPLFLKLDEKIAISPNLVLQQSSSACSALLLGKPEFLKNSCMYHKMVWGYHEGMSKLHHTKIWRLDSHLFRFRTTLKSRTHNLKDPVLAIQRQQLTFRSQCYYFGRHLSWLQGLLDYVSWILELSWT